MATVVAGSLKGNYNSHTICLLCSTLRSSCLLANTSFAFSLFHRMGVGGRYTNTRANCRFGCSAKVIDVCINSSWMVSSLPTNKQHGAEEYNLMCPLLMFCMLQQRKGLSYSFGTGSNVLGVSVNKGVWSGNHPLRPLSFIAKFKSLAHTSVRVCAESSLNSCSSSSCGTEGGGGVVNTLFSVITNYRTTLLPTD